MDAFLARQPILDQAQNLFGYELLFRNGAENYFRGGDGDHATSSLISDAMHLHSIENLTGGHRCFINFTRNAVLNELYTLLPSATTVVEILETVEVDEQFLEACRAVRRQGYALALDDYVLDPRFEQLLPLINLLKVEFPALTEQQHESVLQTAKRFGFQLLAEKVETPEQWEQARQLGYDYFQGYYFCRPQLLRTRRLPESYLQCLRLLQLTSDTAYDVDQVESHIHGDLSLSYKLLRYVNSAQMRRAAPVRSVRQAITTLGRRPLQKWVALIAVNAGAGQKPSELISTCLVRGHFCELIGARRLGDELASEGFLVGMFSLLDALLDQPMDALTRELGLSAAAQAALLRQPSPLLPLLELSIAMESADWESIGRLTSELAIAESEVFDLFSESIVWAATIWPESSDDASGSASA